jgi:hypothetical protein
MRHPFLIRFRTPALVAALAMLTIASGCKKHTEGDGHDHGSKPPAKEREPTPTRSS